MSTLNLNSLPTLMTPNSSSLPKVVVCIPSRGILVAEVIDRLLKEPVAGWLLTHNLPIPDCFNRLSEDFLQTAGDYAWFVEEDTVPPPNALQSMLELDCDIATIRYWLKAGSWSIGGYLNGQPGWVGMGCTLVKRRVFEQL